MPVRRRRKTDKNILFKFAIPFLLAGVVFYIIYQLFSGERGFFTWLELKTQVAEIQRENNALTNKKQSLEQQTQRLNIKTLDEDYLDEQIRKNLPLLKKNDFVLYIEE